MEKKRKKRRKLFLLPLLLPLFLAVLFCSTRLGQEWARPHGLEIQVEPASTADYSEWPYVLFGNVDPLLATLVAVENGAATLTPTPARTEVEQSTPIEVVAVPTDSTLDAATTEPLAAAENPSPTISTTITATVETSTTPTATGTQTRTATATTTSTATMTTTATATSSPTTTSTATITASPTATPTSSVTPRFTPTASATPTETATTSNPIASFLATPSSGNAPLTVNFTNLSSGLINQYNWNFGDGVGTSTNFAPIYIFANPGTYVVTLTVIGPAGNDTTTGTITVSAPPPMADLAISKSVNISNPLEGTNIIFTVSVSNLTTVTTSGVQVRDNLPNGLTFVSASASQGAYNQGSGVWNVGTIAGLSNATLTLTALVNTGIANTTLTNTASLIASSPADTNSGNNSASANVSVQQILSADVGISKTVSDSTPLEGDSIFYTLTVTNNGPDTRTALSINDTLPIGLTYVSQTASQGSYNNATGTWSVGSLSNGTTATLQINVTVNNGTAGSTILNTANIIPTIQPDPNVTNNTAGVSLQVGTPVQADLSVNKSVSYLNPTEGQTISYIITVLNNGPDNATGIQIQDLLPSGVSFVLSNASQGAYNSVSGIWNVGNLTVSVSATLSINVVVNGGTAGSAIINTASITTSNETDPNPTNNSASVQFVPTVPTASADLAVTITASDPTPNEASTTSLQLTLTNNGPNTANNISVRHLFPLPQVLFSSASGFGSYSYSSGEGIWQILSLGPGSTVSMTVTVNTSLGSGDSTVTTTIGISASDQADTVVGNNSASAILTIQPLGLGITVTVSDSTPLEGDTIEYRVRVNNYMGITATGIEVTDILPAGVTYFSDTGGGTYNFVTGVWTVGSISSGSNRLLRIQVTVDAGTQGTTISNTATITAMNQTDLDLSNNTFTRNITVAAPPPPPGTDSDLSITKTINNNMPMQGQSVTYQIRLTNNGPDVASGVQITDLLPTGIQYTNHSTSYGTYDSVTGVWNVQSNILVGPAYTLNITGLVTATAGSTITNSASITAVDQLDVISSNNTASVDFTVSPPPGTDADLALTKTVNIGVPMQGQAITYQITLTNNGPDVASGIQITDLLPTGVQYTSYSTLHGTYNSATGIWNVQDNLLVGSSFTLSITGVAIASNGVTVTNTASITVSDQADAVSSNNTASVDFRVAGTDLAISKMVNNATPNEGDTITYTLTLTNLGPDSVPSGVEVTDILPFGVTYISDNGVGAYTGGVWTISSLLTSGASVSLDIVATVNAGTLGATITNTATITRFTWPDINSVNNNASVDITVSPPSVDFVLGKTVDNSTPNEGDTIVYTVTLFNPNGIINGIAITDILPTTLTFVSASASHGSYNSGTGIWALTTDTNTTHTLQITAAVNLGTGGTTITNTATVTNTGGVIDPNLSNNAASIDVTVSTACPCADLAVTKSVSDNTPAEGQNIEYLVTVTNNGPDNATSVEITDVIPTGLSGSTVLLSQGSYWSGIWTVGDLAVGNVATMRLFLTVNGGTSGSTIINTATLTNVDQTDNVLSNDSASVSLTVSPSVQADLAITQTVDNSNPVVNDTITYELILTNNGPDSAFNVRVNDLLPAGLTYLFHIAYGAATYSEVTGNWDIGVISPSESYTLQIMAMVNTGGIAITNTATVVALDQTDPNLGNNSASTTVNAQDNTVDLQVGKTADNLNPFMPSTFTYTVTIYNSSPTVAATGLQVTDVIPTGLTFNSASATHGTYDSGTGLWNIGTLNPTETATLNLVVDVPLSAPDSVMNTATITALDQPDPNSANNAASVTVNIQGPNLEITKTVSDATPNENDTIVYQLVLQNHGPNTAESISVTDLLPPEVTFVSAIVSDGIYDDGTGQWDIGTMPNGAVYTLNITVTVNTGTSGATITNTATINMVQTDPNPLNNVASVDIVVN